MIDEIEFLTMTGLTLDRLALRSFTTTVSFLSVTGRFLACCEDERDEVDERDDVDDFLDRFLDFTSTKSMSEVSSSVSSRLSEL